MAGLRPATIMRRSADAARGYRYGLPALEQLRRALGRSLARLDQVPADEREREFRQVAGVYVRAVGYCKKRWPDAWERSGLAWPALAIVERTK